MHGLSSNRVNTCIYAALTAVLMTATPMAARADVTSCSAGSTSLSCRLLGVLHWLEAAAFVLVLVLIGVVWVAIHLYRKNRPSQKGGR